MLRPIPDIIREARQDLRCLSAEDAFAEQSLNQGLIIDVREPAEVTEQPAPNSINIPRGVLEMTLSNSHPDPAQTLYIHCASGARATLAAEQLRRLGYRDVTVITCAIENVRKEQGSA
ncbi:rhodanese-like domain-containing protein [Pseudoteredinibacter isoporae]|uniref:rhodanese-like domain-containing protein n=1 Tax=Pseudoteredinibacter isoporae TaxID=570281 RepID=UPI003104BB32